ncbi:MAG: hypothetical protein NTU98_05515 [Bacteroidetes bacterium]|nr:hypothetical protein [Bacteroidota bacterium]
MDTRKEHIEKLVIKLKVLESKIQKLESLTDEVLNEVESEYKNQLKELYLKKEEAKHKLVTIQEAENKE